VEEPVESTGAEDSALQISIAELSIVKFVPAVIILEATTVTFTEVPVTTSTLTEPTAGLVFAPSEDVFHLYGHRMHNHRKGVWECINKAGSRYGHH